MIEIVLETLLRNSVITREQFNSIIDHLAMIWCDPPEVSMGGTRFSRN